MMCGVKHDVECVPVWLPLRAASTSSAGAHTSGPACKASSLSQLSDCHMSSPFSRPRDHRWLHSADRIRIRPQLIITLQLIIRPQLTLPFTLLEQPMIVSALLGPVISLISSI
eukprot:2402271-Rhodomonas_salina.1